MLLEAAHYAWTLWTMQSPNAAAAKSAVSLWSRARRCAKAWAPHESMTKAAIKANCTDLEGKHTVVVLGSGLLRDVPIDFLAKEFRKVILIDIVHLALTRRMIRNKGWDHVVLVERDLSGLPSLLAQKIGGTPDNEIAIQPLAFLKDIPDLDLVISANLLSQIGIGTERRIVAENLPLGPAHVVEIIQAHVVGLEAMPCRALLVTDTHWTESDREGNITETFDLMHGCELPPAQQQWNWTVAPYGEISKNIQVVHRVVACQLPVPDKRLTLLPN